jgi:hypothetical protein
MHRSSLSTVLVVGSARLRLDLIPQDAQTDRVLVQGILQMSSATSGDRMFTSPLRPVSSAKPTSILGLSSAAARPGRSADARTPQPASPTASDPPSSTLGPIRSASSGQREYHWPPWSLSAGASPPVRSVSEATRSSSRYERPRFTGPTNTGVRSVQPAGVDGVRRIGSSCATRNSDEGERHLLGASGKQRDIPLNTSRAQQREGQHERE